MTHNKHLTSQIFVAATVAFFALCGAAHAEVGASTRALAPVSLSEAIARITPQDERTHMTLLGLDSADAEQYIPNLRGQLRHAEGAPVPLNTSIGLDATTLSLELRQPLYRSGQSRAQVQVTDSRLRAEMAAKLDEQRQRNLLIAQTYTDALALDAQRKLSSDFNTTHYRLESAYKAKRKELEKLAGIDKNTPLRDMGSPAFLPTTLQSALSIAEEKHPTIIRAHYECAAAEASSRSLSWDDAPDIDLRGALDRTTDSYTDTNSGESGIIGLRATIPLRGDSERKSMRVQARQDAENGRLKIDTARLEVRQNVIAAWDEVTRARAEEQFETRKAELAQAAAEGRLPAKSRLSAMGNNDAFTRLAHQARLNAVAAHYAAIKAEFALLAATGQLNQALARPHSTPLPRQELAFDLQNSGASSDISIK